MASRSWLDIAPNSHFSLANIPFGIITTPASSSPHVGVAVGKYALDLSVFALYEGFADCPAITSHLDVFSQPALNDFAALGRAVHREVRQFLQKVFVQGSKFSPAVRFTNPYDSGGLFPLDRVKTHLPFRIGDYTDFFVGKHHAQNAGALIRGIDNALHPNYMHLPVGYHGRASSVVVSGTSIRRPHGQVMEDPTAKIPKPIFTPSKRLDFELELGAFVCKANKMGEPVSIREAEENIFGLVLMNDWSARDIQGWEMVPLGPFNSKNFGTSVSAWVVLVDALEPFRVRGIENENEVLPYMREGRKENVYDLNLEVELTTKSGTSTTITRTNGKNLLFSFPQMLAHHTAGGCPMQVGDLLGSGTVSGTEPDTTSGSMLELSANGKHKIQLHGGDERTFLEDYDIVTLKGWAGGEEGGLVGFGECAGMIEPAITLQ
ncbi:MAG: hypothetical protein Q9175_006485 [Cornicularia normoerica]